MTGADSSLTRAITGPIILITVGGLFALDHFTSWGFTRTWPVILIVVGLMTLLRRGSGQTRPQAG